MAGESDLVDIEGQLMHKTDLKVGSPGQRRWNMDHARGDGRREGVDMTIDEISIGDPVEILINKYVEGDFIEAWIPATVVCIAGTEIGVVDAIGVRIMLPRRSAPRLWRSVKS